MTTTTTTKDRKILKGKIFGSVGHLPGSKTGIRDSTINTGEAEYFTNRHARKNDKIIVTEKMDGACVGVYRKDYNTLIPLIRAGYRAEDSPRIFLRDFADMVRFELTDDLHKMLNVGEWIVGEWCQEPHGTKYDFHKKKLIGERTYFFPFAIFKGDAYCSAFEYEYAYVKDKVGDKLPMAMEISVDGEPVGINEAHVALLTRPCSYRDDPAEGAVWRRERDGSVMKRGKWVRPAYVAGYYWNEA